MLNATMMEHVSKRATGHIEQLKDGKSAVEIAAEMYRQNLPGKSEQTSMMMAQHIADTVSGYYRSKGAALENYEAWVNQAFTTATARMNNVQAYNQMYQVYVGAVATVKLKFATTNEEKEIVNNWVKQEAKRSFTDTEATPEKVEELKEKLAAALKDANLLTTQLTAISETLLNEEANAQMVLDFGAINEDVMTLLAMQTYLDAKNGLLEEIPGNVRLEEIALSVCSAMDTYRVAEQVASGKITEEEGEKLLGILGGVFGTLLSITAISYAGIKTAATVYLLLGSNLVAVMAGVVMAVAISKPAVNALSEAGTTVGNVSQIVIVTTVSLVAKGVSILVGVAAKGVKALLQRVHARENEIKDLPAVKSETDTVRQTTPLRETAEAIV